MNHLLKDLHIFIMFILGFVGGLIITLSDINSVWINLLLALCWLFSFSVRNLYIYKTDTNKKYAFITYLIEIILLFIIGILGNGASTRLLLCITTADCYIVWGGGYGTACAAVVFALYTAQFHIHQALDAKSFMVLIGNEAPIILLVGLVSYLIGKVLKSNAAIEKALMETGLREIELKAAYDELNGAYKRLEEVAALRERNRIAREIHDNVGHTLTTVIVEMEAGRMLAEKDAELAAGKFLMAQKQAVKALDELRRSVRLLTKDTQKVNLKQAVLSIMDETEIHANVPIKGMVDIPEKIGEKETDLVIGLLKEGLSNGIRHGAATAFFLKIVKENDRLFFLLQDNGKGCDSITTGFGLDHMKRSVLEAGGSIHFNSEYGEGFEIMVELPLHKGD